MAAKEEDMKVEGGDAQAAPADTAGPSGSQAAESPEERKNAILKKYRERVAKLQADGRAKPDMIAYKELRDELTPKSSHGHIPGVRVGEVFNGKGELAILGIHKAILRGIDSSDKDVKGAYAIVLSGGYGDDDDHGLTINYTGEGGQDGGKQVKSQEFKAGNLALQRSCETGTPVRVCRGKLGPKKERQYVYEGLYNVTAHKQVPSKHNKAATVIIFELRAVEGHAVASTKVTAGIFKKALTSQLLAGRSTAAPPTRRPNKRKRGPSRRQPGAGGGDESDAESVDSGEAGAVAAQESLQQLRQCLLDQNRNRPGVLDQDISRGQEPLPIPLINDTGEAGVVEPAFEYTEDYQLTAEAGVLARESVEAFTQQRREMLDAEASTMCGRCWMGHPGKPARVYQPDGRLKSTQPLGVMECGPACTSPTCRHQAICSRGIRVPLEVFWTGPRGWGVRVAADVAVGTFVCCYTGRVILDSAAEQLRQEEDAYLFSLDHFVLLKREIAAEEAEVEIEVDPAKLPALLPQHLEGEHLVVDARGVGNVARFINHSCSPNCILQTILMREAQGALYYYVAVFTQSDLQAGAELTYNYGYATGSIAGRNMECHCGAANCTGRVL